MILTNVGELLRFKDKRTLETEKPVRVSLVSDKPTKQNADEVLELVPKMLRPKSKIVLTKIEENSDMVNRNNKGDLEYNGIMMPETNIGDLVASSVKKLQIIRRDTIHF